MTHPYDPAQRRAGQPPADPQPVPNPMAPPPPSQHQQEWQRWQSHGPAASSAAAPTASSPNALGASAPYAARGDGSGDHGPSGYGPGGYGSGGYSAGGYTSGQPTAVLREPGAPPSYGMPSGQAATAQAERPRRRTGLIVGSLLAATLLGGAAGFGGGALAGMQQDGQTQSAPSDSGATGETVSDPGTISDVAASAGPSVVTVQAVSPAGGGEGSGVVIADGGYIVTNNHVVTLDGATADATITVETSDGRLLGATIVGTDPVVDLAVIRVDAELPVITIAASDDVRVGDTAVAIGAPLGLSNSVTDGIVSAVDRGLRIASSAAPDAEQDSQQQPFGFWQEDGAQAAQQDVSIPVVQTDASINPGNSGGALLNASGQLIGVNVAIASMGQGQASGSIGIGFAIEASLVQRVVEEIIAEGEASHGLLGATVSDVRDASVGTVGAQVQELTQGGAAAGAGMQPGDVITAIEGAPVSNAVDATAQVRSHAAGSTVTVEYLRGGRASEVDVTLGELP